MNPLLELDTDTPLDPLHPLYDEIDHRPRGPLQIHPTHYPGVYKVYQCGTWTLIHLDGTVWIYPAEPTCQEVDHFATFFHKRS